MNATIATNMLLMMMMLLLLLLMMMLMVMIDCHDGESPNDFEDGICAMLTTNYGDDDESLPEIKSGLARRPVPSSPFLELLCKKPAAHANLKPCILQAIHHEHVLK